MIKHLIKSIGKKTIPTKKIKRISRPILKDRGYTTSFKNLRKATNILSLIKKLQKNLNASCFNHINKKIDLISKTYLFLMFKNFTKNTQISEISWEE